MNYTITHAMTFAKSAHGDQKRKYTEEPYWHHPAAVEDLLREFGISDNNILCAALLHDVVEDTAITLDVIREAFGPDIASLVDDLTDISVPSDGNRKARKHIDAVHTWNGSPSSQIIKCADLIDNTKTIVPFDPRFSWIYLSEKRKLLDGMTYSVKEHPIWHAASILCDVSYAILKKWQGGKND